MLETQHELLLPVGNMEMALAAIHNGADAIYVGFPGYNARGRSIDFELDELKQIIETCHLHGVRANLAFNIVIFQDELEKLVPLLEKILPLKPDALIIQDLGIARLVRKMAPAQVIHASTQMTVTNPDAIALLDDLEIRRFVLGRENSLKEIELIKAQTDKELEVFVHGALCVSYSGQCFTSESIGGRSANRGQCAQSCRFSYEMYVDGEKKNPVQKQYLVSPQDLCGIAEIPALMDLGVVSFKVEGRLKSPEYVASSAQEYRQAIHRHANGRSLSDEETAESRKRMATTYSRGFFTGWLHGVDHQRLVDGVGKSHRGYPIGKVIDIIAHKMTVELDEDTELSPGDSLQWSYWKNGSLQEAGAQIYEIRKIGARQREIQFGFDVELRADAGGARLYLNHIASQKRELRRSFLDKQELKKVAVEIVVKAKVGEKLEVTMSDGKYQASAFGTSFVQEAKNRAVSDEFFKDELGALGGSAFALEHFRVERLDGDKGLFYPHKELKEIRRALTAELEKLRAENRVARPDGPVAAAEVMQAWLKKTSEEFQSSHAQAGAPALTRLTVLLREKAQVFDLIEAWKLGKIDRERLEAVILDFEFGMDYEPSILALREAGIKNGIATTRVLKPKEYTNFTRIERIAPDVILVRNLGALQYFTKVKPVKSELRGDFSLNVTNHLTAQYLLGKGLKSVTASYDLNSQQVMDMLRASDASRFEITAHQYMPSFHMEHCVFAAFLSKGSSFRDCGKPCEKHRVELRDQFGHRHQIKPDQECRNTMYNAVPQSAARFVESWKELGLGSIRYEALYERGDELISKIRGYQDLLSGARSASEIVSELKLLEKYGLGEGAIAKTYEYQSRKK